MNKTSCSNSISKRAAAAQEGFSFPELLIASFILAFIVLGSLQMTTNALQGMGKSKSRGQADAEIASRIERLRSEAFSFLCQEGCANNQLTKMLIYDLPALKPLCASKGLGQAFLNSLDESKKETSFQINSKPAINVTANYIAENNKVHVTYEADTSPMPLVVTTTLVPHAQGWCP